MSFVKKVFEKGEEYRAVHYEDIELELMNSIADIMASTTFSNLRMEKVSADSAFRMLYMVNAINFDECDLARKKLKSAYADRFKELKSLKQILG